MRFKSQATQHAPFERGRLLAFMVAAGAAILCTHWLPSRLPWTAFSVAAIAIAIWHGAFDGVLAKETLQPLWGPRWEPIFYVSYFAATALVALLWWTVPFMALTLFLLYSALHFGTESERSLSPARILAGLAMGFIPIAAACHWWPFQVTEIFRQMLRANTEHTATITSLAGGMLWPVIAAALVAGWQQRNRRVTLLLLAATEVVLFRTCSPLAAFAIFFCFWHTPEHMVSSSLDNAGRFHSRLLLQHLRHGMIPWLISISAMATLFWLGLHTMTAYLGTLFIILSALTVPHMALAEVLRRSSSMAPDQGEARSVSHAPVIHA